MATNGEPAAAPAGSEPVTVFAVVKEPYGWSVRLNGLMMTPFSSREFAVEHACHCAEMLREAGRAAEVTIEEIEPSDSDAEG